MKIIAERIGNLTDGRYFAAMGVDWLGFDLRPGQELTLDAAMAIMDWVSVPNCYVDLRGRDADDVFRVLDKTGAQGVVVDRLSDVPQQGCMAILDNNIPAMPHPHISIINDLNQLYHTPESSEHWFRLSDYSHLALADTATAKGCALLLQGGAEDKPGVKSYDALNILMEHVTDHRD